MLSMREKGNKEGTDESPLHAGAARFQRVEAHEPEDAHLSLSDTGADVLAGTLPFLFVPFF